MKLQEAITLSRTLKSLSPAVVPLKSAASAAPTPPPGVAARTPYLDSGRVVINLSWVERGYLRQTWWDAAVAKTADRLRVARGMVQLARQNAGVIHLRVTIHPLPL